MKKVIQTADAPAAIGPYSQAIQAGNFVYVSGQVPIDPLTGSLVAGGIQEQTHQSFRNIRAILKAAGCTLEDVVKTTVLLSDMADFAAMNAVYESYFTGIKPARSAFAVKGLPKAAMVEIEVVAVLPAQQ
ncbi:MAG: RidA family protein [Bacteroidales bacterium]|jgi:2-iminobutanoate/2-iminopropanoate deaminase|nr:RidA family protein [Bacteroidales bacterium]MDD3166405.1 RidA family protein [Bacteroidales bacterium]MDD4771515.1 RidA family protein [Bacteroidales bacterium]HKL92586.1 RidA family protein [Bacteroidales bacterium]